MYLGWANYATWAVNEWMVSDELNAKEYRTLARRFLLSSLPDGVTREEQAADKWAKHVAKEFDDLRKTLYGEDGIWNDLLVASLLEVDWHEIATATINGLEPIK